MPRNTNSYLYLNHDVNNIVYVDFRCSNGYNGDSFFDGYEHGHGYKVPDRKPILGSSVANHATSTSENCPAPTLCGNQGLQWAYYNNTSGYNPGANSGYPNFLPEVCKFLLMEMSLSWAALIHTDTNSVM